jgi:hypothetical protein
LKREDIEQGSNWVFARFDEVRNRMLPMGYPEQCLPFVKGMVEDTIPSSAPDQIGLLRLDTDFFSSTKHELNHLYDRLVPGGVVVIDDYGVFSGAQQATDEFFKERRLLLLLGRADEHVRIAIKPPRDDYR